MLNNSPITILCYLCFYIHYYHICNKIAFIMIDNDHILCRAGAQPLVVTQKQGHKLWISVDNSLVLFSCCRTIY